MTELPGTLAALAATPWGRPPLRGRSVKDELRSRLLARLRLGGPVFPGVVGYDETVIPALSNAVLSRHNFVLLGLRGQAKSRLLRALVDLLEDAIPAVAGCEIHDDPFAPLCAACRQRASELGPQLPIAWIGRERRFIEKLATPDVTVADIIGDIDPIRAARAGLDLSNELTIHWGLLPRANRGIFALNELPDLAGKVQVGLFNVMQEGDIQIKGYPVRLPLDVALVFSANPEDYTARGKIITPLKDRIGSEIRTHYPATLGIGMRITEAEAWTSRQGAAVVIPDYVREIVEGIAFGARDDSRIDKRSGVSQRLPISCLENVVSNAERRAALAGLGKTTARVADVYAALPAVTGKIELEYEGEMRGAEAIAREVVRVAVARAFDRRFNDGDTSAIVTWFDEGGIAQLDDAAAGDARLAEFDEIPTLREVAERIADKADADSVAGACELVLEGLFGKRRISRSEDKIYMKSEPVLNERSFRDPSQFRRGAGGDEFM